MRGRAYPGRPITRSGELARPCPEEEEPPPVARIRFARFHPAGAAASCPAEQFHAARASAQTEEKDGKQHGRQHGRRSQALSGVPESRGGEHRSNALWGKGGRGFVTTVLVVASALPLAAGAGGSARSGSAGGYVSEQLKDKAKQHLNEIVSVIIQSDSGLDAASAAKELADSIAPSS